MELEWNIDLVTAGLSWPDFLEDKLLAVMMREMLKSYDDTNPMVRARHHASMRLLLCWIPPSLRT